MNQSAYGCDRCEVHGGKSRELAEAKGLYILTEVRSRQRLAQLGLDTENDPVQALMLVVATLRRLVEKRQNMVRSDMEFVESVHAVDSLLQLIERVRRSALIIEANLGTLLSKPAMMQLGRVVNEAVIDELEGIDSYESITRGITNKVLLCITHATNESVDSPIAEPAKKARGRKKLKSFLIEDEADQARIAELVRHEAAKSIVEEINVSVLMIERRWNLVKTDLDLIQATPMLTKQFKTLEKLVRSAHEVEQRVGNLLTPETQQKVILAIIKIVEDGLEDVPRFEELTQRVIQRIADTLHNKEAAKTRLLGVVDMEESDGQEERLHQGSDQAPWSADPES